MKVWMNGQLVDKDQARISVFDHCVLYGDGVFEGIRSYGGKIFRRRDHLERLFASAETIRLKMSYTREQLTDAMYATMAANGVKDGYIRLVVTRGIGTLGLDPLICTDGVTFIIADQIALYPQETYEKGLAVIIAKTRRRSPDMLPPAAKLCNYLNNILAKIECVDAGVPEALMLNADGDVAEATGDNVFIVTDGAVITPPPEAGILIGVTRGVVIELCEKLGIPLRQERLSVEQVYSADECFLTGTAAEVIAVTKVDDKIIGSGKAGPITTKLLKAFREYIAAGEFD